MAGEKQFDQFEPGEVVHYEGYEMKVISEFERTVIVEFSDYPIVGKEEEFPYHRIVLLKNEVTH
ncbi:MULTISPECIES: hypothetical protein [Marinococcus]|jgi:uncharacterized protein (UPF0248 family)|uniref:DUF2187 domain-containing protein n=2 Tax=Marinococcus TaxID=1370 RepID=A0A1H2TRY1_9BACI|nr:MULTISPECIES: hypothetical protein [Marinococcus]MDX6154130.1 hypothetical protein [Marinococcus sp. PL1-022]MDZ5782734.1 hypothetical protein [Marinococcus luteus]OZT81866.1 hypothetical protein CHL76_01880 [Marinococcus halophilus]SDW46024.1 hypothetical protein SAMN05421781_1522 [Marinococcus luteus]GEK59265.1 hypothetical protein MHA01_21700 [Marinococcus halophilus]